jgi:hypothetical protein
MSIDPITMDALLILITGGIVTTITQIIKSLLKATGTLALILTGLIAVAATAAYFFIINPPFDLVKFAFYAVVIFGEATGYYHLYRKEPTA